MGTWDRREAEGGVLITGTSTGDGDWVELHDLLLDEWISVWESVRKAQGRPVGVDTLMPVRLAMSNITCMHNCDCMDDADMDLGVAGHTPGSRHALMRLVAVCEPCLRTNATPMTEGEAASGPIQ